jgi:ATP phosphoribosyltransferase
MKKIKKLKFGFPSGLLRDQTIKLFEAAGYEVKLQEDLYQLKIDDPEIDCVLSRAQEITHHVERGTMDAGITEKAFILDHKVDVIEVADFSYGHKIWGNAKIVLAVPENSKIKSVKDLKGKKILARVPEITKNYLKRHKIEAKVEFVDRPGEPKIPTFGEAVVEFTNTGEALRAHRLRVLDVLMETSPRLIANRGVWKDKWKREKIENLAILLKGARLALEYSGLMLHASDKMMERVLKVLPSLKKPSVTQLRGENWFDVLAVVKKKELRVIIPKLKKIGCTDIVEFPLNKVVI